ncbi:MAG: uridine phosphorylase [Pseudomonadota bacterium]
MKDVTHPYLANMPSFEKDGVPQLTGFRRGTIAKSVVLAVRDPLTVGSGAAPDAITQHLDGATLVAETGLFTTFTGTHRGVPISVVNTGSGAPEAELVLMDLFNHTDAETVIRIGGSGGWSDKVKVGDAVITSGAVRDEGLTKAHVRAEYPAFAHHTVVAAMVAEAEALGVPHHVGVTRCGDSEYTGWGKPGPGGYLQPDHAEIIDYWRRAGILNTDRECAPIMVLAALYGRKGGSVCSIGDNLVTGEPHRSGAGYENAIRIGLGALARLGA